MHQYSLEILHQTDLMTCFSKSSYTADISKARMLPVVLNRYLEAKHNSNYWGHQKLAFC